MSGELPLRDIAEIRRRLVDWIREQVQAAGMNGVIFGLSGGVDSAVVCGLAAEALGPERCLGVVMPADSSAQDTRLGHEVADAFGVRAIEVDLSRPVADLRAQLQSHLPALNATDTDDATEQLAAANIKPRMRMVTLYFYANLLGYLVVGTGNKAEFTLGYFTKWGDGAADMFLLAELLKHEVWALARALGVPAAVVDRAPSAGLWEGQTDEQEMGLRYEQIDRFLATGSSGDPRVDAEIRRRFEGSRHKVASPPIAQID